MGKCPQQPEEKRSALDLKKIYGDNWALKEHVAVIWFEAWRYQHEKAPIAALLHEICAQLSSPSGLWEKVKKYAKKYAGIAKPIGVPLLKALVPQIAEQATKIIDVGKKWKRDNLAATLPSHRMRNLLEEAFKSLLPERQQEGPAPRILVLVDDLDRCESESAFQLLEGIKIYLNLPNCVFVLGMNQDAIESAIAKHISCKEEIDRAQVAHEYIEKLCQAIWHLPVLAHPEKYLRTLLDILDFDNELSKIICDLIEEHKCLPGNPRKIKAFANVLYRFIEHLNLDKSLPNDPKEKRPDVRLLIVMASLYHFHQDLYRIVSCNSNFYNEIYYWSSGLPTELEYERLSKLDFVKQPKKMEEPDTEAVPLPKLVEAFPDPVKGNVFRIQNLVNEIKEVEPDEIELYLLI